MLTRGDVGCAIWLIGRERNHHVVDVSDDDRRRQCHAPLEGRRYGNKKRNMVLSACEFLGRFFLHVLPQGSVRIRHFGFLPTRHRKTSLELCRHLLHAQASVSIAAIGDLNLHGVQPAAPGTCESSNASLPNFGRSPKSIPLDRHRNPRCTAQASKLNF